MPTQTKLKRRALSVLDKFVLASDGVTYSLDSTGRFVIENYNQSKPFSNFFPGIAGLWGVPMWAFYVNRGQCVASFGIESKDKAIMEFQPANKAYRLTAIQGFRTFLKVKTPRKTIYWEPFQNGLLGTDFKKRQVLSMSAHDLTIEETNEDLGLTIQVNFFTLPEESYPALIRRVTMRNIGKKPCAIEMIDGLPMIIPYGLNDGINKNMSRTVEALVKVRNLENQAPYYQLNVEVSDTPQVKHIKEGNFFFSFDFQAKNKFLLTPLVESARIFGASCDFTVPSEFLNDHFTLPKTQQTSNRTPSAMAYSSFSLKRSQSKEIVSLFGHADTEEHLNQLVKRAVSPAFIKEKARRNEEIITEIKNFALTVSSSHPFNLYCGQTFLDNILRGGLPVSIQTSEGAVAFNVYSRKHGDLERDYNYFRVAPTFYSQGNGNYRDVNQNRRNDIWFNTDVKDQPLVSFLNLIQADGYNPLVVKGTSFVVEDKAQLEKVLKHCVDRGIDELREYLAEPFLPGDLLKFVQHNGVRLKVDIKEFLGELLRDCHKQEMADHGEGFWSDHWTYNLDLIERYLALHPEHLEDLLLKRKGFKFYFNAHYVKPRDQRYILNHRGVRQYHSVRNGSEELQKNTTGSWLRTKKGEGSVYSTTLIVKLLVLIANKMASLDPSGVGVEMEADKPNWYDALNGLPGLLGSAISETFEVKRLSVFVLEAIKQLSLDDQKAILIFEELATLIEGLMNILSLEEDSCAYWNKSNDVKENYRKQIREGIGGDEKPFKIREVKNFLELVIHKTNQAIASAFNPEGFLPTYFYHEVSQHDVLDRGRDGDISFVRPLAFQRHDLPLFLEGYVHALRVCSNVSEARKLYQQVRASALFDRELKMYRVNEDLSGESEEIGRTRIFPRGWLENESIWLHMEYKFMLELLRSGLFQEFYENFEHVFIPFLNPEQYGRSTLENSSFIVSSSHEDPQLHGQGFVARLSGSTAEFLHIWFLMNVGKDPFRLNVKKELELFLQPALTGKLFTTQTTAIDWQSFSEKVKTVRLLPNSYAFSFLGSTLVVYQNPKRKDTFGPNRAAIKEIQLTYHDLKKPVVISSSMIPAPHAQAVRSKKIERIDVYFA